MNNENVSKGTRKIEIGINSLLLNRSFMQSRLPGSDRGQSKCGVCG